MQFKTQYPPATKGKLVVWGYLATAPFGGMTWQVFHYLVGFRRLGFEVWYVEDVSWRTLLDPVDLCPTWEYSGNLRFMKQQMEQIGLGDKWVFRPPGEEQSCLGALTHIDELNALYKESDAVFNLCFSQEDREGHENISCRVLLETDPVMSQVLAAQENEKTLREYDKFHYHFSYGENLGAPDCKVPITRYKWYPTRPPVCLDWWDTKGAPPIDEALTTITNFNHSKKNVYWNGERWAWEKYIEFLKVLELPRHSPIPLKMAMGGLEPREEREKVKEAGWIITPSKQIQDPLEYRHFIRNSTGEFTVAKQQYVAPRSGWFSDRSVCYLAAGRPVITQSTGFEKFIPAGHGLFAFSNQEEALVAIEAIAQDYQKQSAAARDIAAAYFDTNVVLGNILQRIGLL